MRKYRREAFSNFYSAQTTVTVAGPSNTSSTISLGSLVNPVKELILEKPLFYYKADHTVPDRYGVINGSESNISMVKDSAYGFRGSYQFTDSMIRVPNHSSLDKPDQLGFSLHFKPHAADGTLVNYSLRSQILRITADNRLQYEIETDTGTYNVSSAVIDLNEWHQVAAHYNNNQIQLEVDGVLTTAPATGELVHQIGTTGIRLGDGFQGQMNQFKVIDWTAPDLVVFANGESSQDVSYDAEGKHAAQIFSTGQMGKRTIVRYDDNEQNRLLNFFIPSAYAAEAGASLPMQVDISNSNVAQHAEKLYLATKQSIQDNFPVGYEVGRILWEQNKETLKTILGAADFIIGFIPFVGDGKDLALQAIYKYIGSDEYDELVVIVATLGLAADGIALVGAAATPITGGASAIVAGGAATFSFLAKTIKLYTRVMPRALNKVLVNFFRKLFTKVKTRGWDYASNSLAFTALLYGILGDNELREMLYGMIQTDDDLFAWVDYIGSWENQPEVSASNNQVLDFFLKPALAARSIDQFLVVS